MLSEKGKLMLAKKWRHFLEALIYTECLAHGMKNAPILEIADDNACYQAPGIIHLGTGMINAEDEEDLFAQLHYLLGHEMQHLLSTTARDWEAAQTLCFRDACQRISVRVFGKTRRLTKESDYDRFFQELAGNGIFVNQHLLRVYAHFILNSLEDGRDENIRQKKHPGFGEYRKVFRGKMWLDDDFRDEEHFHDDPDDMDSVEELKMILGQLYYLATLGIYQKGFLDAYEGTKAKKTVDSFIPEISKAVLGRSCKVCMEQGRAIFNRLLDRVLDACTLEADAKAVQEFLEKLLEKLLSEAENQKFSASPNTEEQGDGLPAESPFGQSVLEIEMDEEEYEELMKDAEEDDVEDPSVRIKVRKSGGDEDDEEDSDEGENTGDEDSSAEALSEEESSSAPPSDKPEKSNSADDGSDADGSDEGENSDAAGEGSGNGSEANGSDKDKDSEGNDACNGSDAEGSDDTDSPAPPADGKSGLDTESNDAQSSDDQTSDAPDSESSGGAELNIQESSDNEGFNNKVEAGVAQEKGSSDLEKDIREAAAKAAEAAKADFELAEADAQLDELFKEAAEGLRAVPPAEVDISKVDDSYSYDVEFVESTRAYDPIGRLPLELENKGKSLHHKIEELVKNKQDPDQRYLKSGMLDTRRLTSLALGDLNVFKKKGEPNKSDVACFLLQDNSGSMGNGPGSTRFACCNAFAVLEEGFKHHMPLKIAAFDSSGICQVAHEVVKEFDEVTEPNLAFNFRDLGRGGWGNKDGYSIRVATQQLLARPEKDKILIIASDGFPTEYRGGYEEGCADVKAAVAEARKAGIRTIGMYMYKRQDKSDFAVFEDMYGPEIIFASLDEIEDELTRILKRYF